jgi:hypothetical protein
MDRRRIQRIVGVALLIAGIATPVVVAQDETKVKIPIPQPTVPENFTAGGQFSRIAYNNEGWATLGYRIADGSQGKDWLLLEVGVTVSRPSPNQTMTRDSFAVKLPDGSMVPLASQREFQEAGYLRAMVMRANTVNDSINYFPNRASQGCPMILFTDPASASGALAFDQFEISWQRSCVGRQFFKLPEGQTIEPGQYWLVVKFTGSTVEVPFRIFTKEEEKYFKKNWKSIKKEHDAITKQEAAEAKAQQQK